MKALLTLLFTGLTAAATAQCSAHLLLDKRIHTDAYVVLQDGRPALALRLPSDSALLVTASGTTLATGPLGNASIELLRSSSFTELRSYLGGVASNHLLDARSSGHLNKLASCAALPNLAAMPLEQPAGSLSAGDHLVRSGRLRNASIAVAIIGGGLAGLLSSQGDDATAGLIIGGATTVATLTLQVSANQQVIKAGRKLGK
jgi:hypothetical protein